MERVYNFAAGPATMPREVLETIGREMVSYQDKGMSVMEMSHRSGMYQAIFDETEGLLRRLMNIPDTYACLFLQGGATLMFAATALNLMKTGRADYIDSGNFASGAMKEAGKYGKARCVCSSKDENYTFVPDWEGRLDDTADYLHITTNNTIYGTRYPRLPKGGAPLVADMSSNILSEVYDINAFGAVYAGAQKNIGPAGLTVVIVRKDLLGSAREDCPKVMNWALECENGSMLNTPNTFAIYTAGLCFKWLLAQGGVAGIEKINIEKANLLYDALDESRLFKPTAKKEYRSRMNVTFVTGDKDTDAAFVKFAAARGLVNLKGHRLVGGIRASIYNAMPTEGVKALIDCMKAFERENA